MSTFSEEEYSVEAEEVLSTLEEIEQKEAEETQYTEEVWGKAMQRIEEANLFKLLIKDSIFQAGSASPAILSAVNKKIKAFAIRELENLLGIPNQQEKESVQLPFDKEEVMALKVLVSTMLKRSKPVAVETLDKTPKLNQIAVKDTAPKQRRAAFVGSNPEPEPVQAPKITPMRPNQPPRTKKVIGKAPPKGEFAKPSNTRPLPMPKANQVAANLAPGAMVISGDPGIVNQGNSALLSQIVGQLAKSPVHVDTGTVNRFK